MAATVIIERHCGVSGATDITDITDENTRANTYDSHSTADVASPIQVPTSGSNFSYWVHTRLNATGAPTGTIDNLRWFTTDTVATAFGTDVECLGARANSGANNGYRQASGTCGTTGDELTTTAHDGLKSSPSNVFSYTSGSPLSLSGTITGATGRFGDYFVYQTKVGTSAGPGATNKITFTFRYDET